MNVTGASVLAACAATLVLGLSSQSPAVADQGSRNEPTTTDQARDRAPHSGAGGLASTTVLCPVDDLSIPESSSSGVATEWLSYGQSLTISPYGDRIWSGAWFSGWNGPEGWLGTSAAWNYPAPSVPRYSLVARIGNGGYQYVGGSPRTFTNNTPGYIQRVRLRVNDDVAGNGAGAFRAFVRYPCQ